MGMGRQMMARELLRIAKELIGAKKEYYLQVGLGKAKYVVNFHDGRKTHKDGSPFYDVRTFRNRKEADAFMKDLAQKGYKER